jgi:thymidylate synthase (FAD)
MTTQTECQARFVTEPMVCCIAETRLDPDGTDGMVEWVRSRAPACLPEELTLLSSPSDRLAALFPHDGMRGDFQGPLTDNELLVELAGRSCYLSYGLKAGKKTNREYIAHILSSDPVHASVCYHAKMTFFIAGVSRRVSHELIRNYVGADRDEEGSPSQQSTRYVENAGFYVIPPKYLDEGWRRNTFEAECHANYYSYREMVSREIDEYVVTHRTPPKGMDYKRILEAASALLMHSVETSWVWTTNPMALAKLFKERDHEAADKEFQRLCRVWKAICLRRWPNLFPQPWMQTT